MKEKEPESFIEKDRKHRDRTKKRRLTNEDKAPETRTPRMEPYKRQKNWVNQKDED